MATKKPPPFERSAKDKESKKAKEGSPKEEGFDKKQMLMKGGGKVGKKC